VSGVGRITQLPVEVIGPTASNARVTQLYAEAIAPLHTGHGRITQLYGEVIGPDTAHGRITQLYAEPIGPPGSGTHLARITQLYSELIGTPIITTPCLLPALFKFFGDVSGGFYTMKSLGSESVPIMLEDSVVTIDYSSSGNIAQRHTQDGGWIAWLPLNGAVQIKFSNGNPVRTLWIVTSAARATPPKIWIWASSSRFDLWKQECSPP
jgi:hypothetical protein